jgi:hypothetical protein
MCGCCRRGPLRDCSLPARERLSLAHIMCQKAAESGSVELLQYLKQQGCAFSEQIMCTAAQRGLLHVCQYLHTQQCPWSARACTSAAVRGHLSTLRWLHEQGCPWHIEAVRMSAAASGHLAVVAYAHRCRPAASAVQLTQMPCAAGCFDKLPVARWLRQQGAEWPQYFSFNGMNWSPNALLWAEQQGCASTV